MATNGDPFFDALQALQPSVDIVILPPDEPTTDAPYTDPTAAGRAVEATRSTIAMLLTETGVVDADELAARGTMDRWDRNGADRHEHRSRARVDLADAGAALDALFAVRDLLHAAGWQPEAVDSPTPWFIATSPARTLTVDFVVEGVELVVTVTSDPLRFEDAPV